MRIRRLSFGVVLFCLCSAPAFATGTNYTWTGKAPSPGNQDWSNAQNWSPSNTAPPTASDTAVIGPVNSSGFTVKVGTAVTVESLTVITSLLEGGGSVTVNTAMECENAGLSPAGGIVVEGDFSVDPVPNIPAYNTTTLSCPMTIDGSGTITSNAVLEFGAAVSLENNGVFDVLGGSQLVLLSGPGSSFINNALFRASDGLARVNGGDSVFTNAPSGTVMAGSEAALQIQGTLDDSGNFQVSGDGIIIVTAKTAFHNGANFMGGTTLLASGNDTLDGTVTVSGILQMGTNGVPDLALNGTLDVVSGGDFQWLGGGLTGSGTSVTGTILVDTNGVMQINNLNGLTLRNLIVTNNGSIDWEDSGVWFMGYNAQINNAGSFHVSGDGSMEPLSSGTPGYNVARFENADGMFQKTFGSTSSGAATTIGIPFHDGNVFVEQGTLAFAGGGSIDTWRVAGAAAIQLKSGNYTVSYEPDVGVAEGVITGFDPDDAGPVIMNSGVTLTNAGTLTIAEGGTFIQSGGIIGGPGGFEIGNLGTFVWNGGTISSGGVSIEPNGVMTISGASSIKNIVSGSIYNEGTVVWTNANGAGTINVGDNVLFDNFGIFKILCDSYMNDVSTNYATRPVFTNEVTGVITKAGNSGTTAIGIDLVNLGKIIAVAGNLEFGPYGDELAGLDLSGLEMEGGKVTFDDATVIHGNVAGSGTIVANHGLTFSGDEVDIYLIIFYGDITNDGTFVLLFGSPGDVTFQNNFSQTAKGRVVIPMRGTNAAAKDFGQLIVSGLNQAFLNGTLQMRIINGFAPPVGATFPLLTSFQRNGTFSQAVLPQGMQLNYTAGGATLTVTGAVPVQIISPAITNGQFQFGFNTISNRSYTVQYRDDLATGTWMFLTNFTGDGNYWQAPLLSPLVGQRYYRVGNP